MLCCAANKACSAYVFLKYDSVTAYLSRGALENCYQINDLLFDADKLIFGNAGEKYSSAQYLSVFGERMTDIVAFDPDVRIDKEYAKEHGINLFFSKDKVILNG